MSEHTALWETSSILAERLRESFLADPQLAVQFIGGHVVSLKTPREMRAAPESGLSVWLYKVDRDEFTSNRPSERLSSGRLRLPPITVDLHYLLTPLSSDVQTEQLILGRVLQTLHDSSTALPTVTRPDVTDTLRVTLENLDLESLSRVWNALQEPYQLSLSYRVQVVSIRSNRDLSGSPVLERTTDYVQIVGVP
jgi:hypothetical protein